MRIRHWIAWVTISALLLPLFVGAAVAIVVTDPGATAQRVTIMANQVTQATTLTEQLTEMRSQLDHMREAARGEIEALTAPFTELASETTGLVSDGMAWKSQFSGVPGQLANAVTQMGNSGTSLTNTWSTLLQQADVVTEADITALYSNQTSDLSTRGRDSWEKSRERADLDLVLNQALADAAAELAKSLKDAKDALDGLRNQTNVSNTALAQAQLSGSLTQGNLAVAQAQAAAYEANKEAVQALQDEHYRRQMIGAWTTAQQNAQTALQARLTAIAADGDAWQQRTLLRVPAFYSGQSPPTP